MFIKEYKGSKKRCTLLCALLVTGMLVACGQEQIDEDAQVYQTIAGEDVVANDTGVKSDKSSTLKDDTVEATEKENNGQISSDTKITDKQVANNAKAKELKEKFGANCIAEQTFEVELSEYSGKVYFVPFAPSADNPEFTMQIIQRGEVLTDIRAFVPEELEGQEFTSLDAVSFCDVNFDNNTDILLIETYGDTTFAAIYYGFAVDAHEYDRYFMPQEGLSENVTSQVETLTISEIRTLLTSGKKNGEFQSYKEAYTALGKLSELEGMDEDYNLIYFDENDIPELVMGINGYYVSLYTYNNGMVYRLMDQWGYGAMGNAGYEYAPRQNSMRNYNTDYAGAICYTTYAAISEQYSLDVIAEIKYVNFDDVNENGMPDEDEEDSIGYYGVNYLNGVEATDEECAAYDKGEYEYIQGAMSLEELRVKLN